MNAKRKSSKKRFAKRSLGQNFLVDQNYIDKIIDSLGRIESSHVIEIGPGRGALTSLLAERARLLTAIELDTEFARSLKAKYKAGSSVRVLEMDVLEADLERIAANGGIKDVKIVANLPYNISTPVLRMLSTFSSSFSSAMLMLQKEVVERIAAKPGDRSRGYLTVLTEAYFDIEWLFDVPPKAFRPVPKVFSAVVRLTPKSEPVEVNGETFKSVLSAGFGQKRKTISNNLKNLAGIADPKAVLASVGLEPNLRPDALELKDWVSLAQEISDTE